MQKIYVDFLSDLDKQSIGYKAAKHTLARIDPKTILRCTNLEEIRDTLANYNTDDEALLITFMAHGYPEDIRTGARGFLDIIPYTDLLPVISRCRTTHPLILNLMGTCSSHGCGQFLTPEMLIDEIWGTSKNTVSVDKSLLCAERGNFDEFYKHLEGSDQLLYVKVK